MLAARCPNAKFVHKNSLCFMEIIIFQLLSCLYLYDSSIAVPVRIRKKNRYTGFQPGAFRTMPPVYRPLACGVDNRAPVYRLLAVALISRAAGIPGSGVQRVKTILKLLAHWPVDPPLLLT